MGQMLGTIVITALSAYFGRGHINPPCRLYPHERKPPGDHGMSVLGQGTKSLRSSPLRGGNALDRPNRCAIVRQAACPDLTFASAKDLNEEPAAEICTGR